MPQISQKGSFLPQNPETHSQLGIFLFVQFTVCLENNNTCDSRQTQHISPGRNQPATSYLKEKHRGCYLLASGEIYLHTPLFPFFLSTLWSPATLIIVLEALRLLMYFVNLMKKTKTDKSWTNGKFQCNWCVLRHSGRALMPWLKSPRKRQHTIPALGELDYGGATIQERLSAT